MKTPTVTKEVRSLIEQATLQGIPARKTLALLPDPKPSLDSVYRVRHEVKQFGPAPRPIRIMVRGENIGRLSVEASRRKVAPSRLLSTLVNAVLSDNMVTAVLDDYQDFSDKADKGVGGPRS